ncbi:hypothetical protein [Streptococcus oricebi]|uniref:Uncharacterized protein n=1 Tax=Streptococcus oricebi TaxID=1547447 RepID=A0ABS5B2X2_9STRE|nr:hypothetical protein [Streptococcus oricebi]MBP2623174.1 hypothetical protein [Streptococcus oricebi]
MITKKLYSIDIYITGFIYLIIFFAPLAKPYDEQFITLISFVTNSKLSSLITPFSKSLLFLILFLPLFIFMIQAISENYFQRFSVYWVAMILTLFLMASYFFEIAILYREALGNRLIDITFISMEIILLVWIIFQYRKILKFYIQKQKNS